MAIIFQETKIFHQVKNILFWSISDEKKLLCALIISLFSTPSFSTSFGVFDPRSLAMGGTGVASGDASNASHYNPALLSVTHEDDDFNLVVPTVTVGYSDPKDLQDALDTYDKANYETALDAAISTYNSSATAASLITNSASVATAAQNIKNGVNTLAGKALVINASAGVLFAIPGKKVAVSVYTAGRAVGGVNLNISTADNTLLQDYIDVLSCIGNLGGSSVTADIIACDTGTNDVINNTTGKFNNTDTATALTSTIDVRGAVITEEGISFAHKFESLYDIAIGITPKAVNVNTFDSAIGVEKSSVDLDTGRKNYTDSNIDLGIAKKISDNAKVGLVAKNLIGKEYKTILNNTVKLKPQYRAGIAYQNDWALVAADVDLTKNEGFGYENDTQIAAVGLELDLFDTVQFRAGYSHNLANTTAADDGTPSVGVGFSPFGVHIDLAVASNNAGLQAGLQLGFKF